MRTLVFFLEEPSAEEMLKGVLPRVLPGDIYVKFLVFEGKRDLEKKLESRIKKWLLPDSLFVVLRDQDLEDCILIKRNLLDICKRAKRGNVLVRIACRELESFYLGDLAAVEQGLRLKKLKDKQNKNKFRAPDSLENPSHELIKLTDYKYQKVSGSRAIAPLLSLDGSNRSHSFNKLITGIKTLIENRA